MVKFTFISANDIHISDINPRARIDNYKEAILNKIAQWREACIKHKADAALCAGDIYNIKYPVKNSHRLNQELIEEFKKFPCPIYVIEGNHDLTADRLDSLKEQPLGVLFADKTLHQLRHEIIEKEGHKVSLVGIPFSKDFNPKALLIPENKGYIAQICLLHIYSSFKAGNLFKEKIFGYDELSTLSPNIFVIGHYHVDQGIHEENGKYFVNIGSISRGSLAEDSLNHEPKLGLIQITDKKIAVTTIKLNVKPAREIFDLAKKNEEEKENKEIELFVDKLSGETFKPLTENSIDTNIDTMNVAEDIKKTALHYIQLARMAKK